MVKEYHKHVIDNNGIEIRIDFSYWSGSYSIYQDGLFIESLDKYDTEDMERLKMWELL